MVKLDMNLLVLTRLVLDRGRGREAVLAHRVDMTGVSLLTMDKVRDHRG